MRDGRKKKQSKIDRRQEGGASKKGKSVLERIEAQEEETMKKKIINRKTEGES